MLETLANWGEFVGGIAVVVSLGYLGVQARSSVKQGRVDSYTRIAELWTQWTMMVAGDDEASRIFYHGSQDYESLTAAEQSRYNQIMSMYFGILDTAFVHELEKVPFQEETLKRMKESAYAMSRRPGVRLWWQQSRGHVFAPNVEAYVHARFGEEKPDPKETSK